MPGENVAPMFAPDSRFAQRAGFTRNHVWVTAYDPEQRFAAGDYPYQHPGGDGLPRFAAADRPTEDTDVVLWYTFGAHHIVRPEDWPVMPVTHIGFKLKPSGFFDGNPALDMPASRPAESATRVTLCRASPRSSSDTPTLTRKGQRHRVSSFRAISTTRM